MIDSKTFLVCAAFVNEEGDARLLSIPFGKEVQKAVESKLSAQKASFEKLEQVAYDGRYKVDNDECLVISDYQDPDGTIKTFLDFCEAKVSDELTDVDDLEDCKALLICIPGQTRYVLIQRFYRSLLAAKSKFYGLLVKDTFSNIERSAFSFGSSVTAIYDIQERKLCFRSVSSIRGALPKFDECYAPGADDTMMQKFFANKLFDQPSAEDVIKKDSTKLSRLVWLINNEGINISEGVEKFARIDELLNMHCYKDGVIIFPSDVKRIQIILRTILGDVYEEDGKVYLSNSRKALEPFE